MNAVVGGFAYRQQWTSCAMCDQRLRIVVGRRSGVERIHRSSIEQLHIQYCREPTLSSSAAWIMHELLQPDSLQTAASLITTEVVFCRRKLQTKCRAVDWQHKATAHILQQRRKLPAANYPRKHSMHSYYSPKFSMKVEAQVAYRVVVKVKHYTSLITLDIFTSSCSPLLDLENNSTPTSKK